MTFDDVRAIALRLPGVEQSTSYGTPSFRAGKKFLSRLREPDVLVVGVGFDEREMLAAVEPETFFVTDHYRGYPLVLVKLSKVHPGTLERLLIQSWRRVASKRALLAFDNPTGQEAP